jgi:hypothetical protein
VSVCVPGAPSRFRVVSTSEQTRARACCISSAHMPVVETLVQAFEIEDEDSLPPSPRIATPTMPAAFKARPRSSASSKPSDLPDDMEVFELPPELAWLSQATSLPGADSFDDDASKARLVDDSRASTPSTVLDVEPIVAVPAKQVTRGAYFSRPQHGGRAAGGSVPRLHGPSSNKSWSWRRQAEVKALSPRNHRPF